MIAAGPAHAGLLAAIHAGAFPPEAAWDAEAFAVQLGLPGVFGLLRTSPPSPCGRGLAGGVRRHRRGWRALARTRTVAGARPLPLTPSRKGRGDVWSPEPTDSVSGLILARVIADQSEILTLAVVPAARRRGIGGALLRAAMRAAAERGAASLFLEVSAGNDPARSLYAAAGFREVGRRNRYCADGTDALVLARALSGGATTSG